MITTTKELKTEFARRAEEMGLECPCISDGTINAEIAVIGEAPGEREIATHLPLVGPSGALLWAKLRKYDINRTNVYVTNVCKRQVSMGNDKRFPLNRNELDTYTSLLQWELAQLPNLKYILVLGNMALQAVCGVSGITHWRGSVLESTGFLLRAKDTNGGFIRAKVICTYNPAAIIREPKLELTFNMDLARLPKVVRGEWNPIAVETHINPSADEAIDWIRLMREKGQQGVAYDIETLSNETACVGLAADDRTAMCINFRGGSLKDHNFTLREECNVRRELQAMFLDDEVKLIAQNNMFDASWLWFKDRIQVQPAFHDTMLAHHTLYPQLPHNLGYISSQYTQRPYYKDEKDEWKEGGDINGYWRYNGQDCCNTHASYFAMHRELKGEGLSDFFYSHVMRAQPHLIRVVVGGLLIDTTYKNNLKEMLERRVNVLRYLFERSVREVTHDKDFKPNPRSPKQMTELYFTRLKLVGRGVSTDEENRKRMYAHPATTEPKRRILNAVDRYTEEAKFYSTYANSGVDDDNRMRCTYNQTGVQSAPGRLSSSGMLWKNKDDIQSGMNLQNQPKRAYPMFIADPGYGFGYFDAAQAEARLVACYANISKWLEQFERNRLFGDLDVHRALAAEMFQITYDEVPAFDHYSSADGHPPPTGKKEFEFTHRYIGKRCRHGLNYRMMPDRLSSTTGLSLLDATIAFKKYHAITPELQKWWGDLEQEIRDKKMLFNAFGRRFILLERLSPEALESIVAFKPQSTLGDKIVRVMYQCESDPKWPRNARLALNIHDALVCLAPLDVLEGALSIMKRYAEEPILVNGHSLIIPAETKISIPQERFDPTGQSYGAFHSWGKLEAINLIEAW